jgi:hypothetical protein
LILSRKPVPGLLQGLNLLHEQFPEHGARLLDAVQHEKNSGNGTPNGIFSVGGLRLKFGESVNENEDAANQPNYKRGQREYFS